MSNNNIHINREVLINYAHGMLRKDIAEQVKRALENDDILHAEYQGILLLMEDNPGEDVEQIIQQKVSTGRPLANRTESKRKVFHFLKPISIAATVLVIIAMSWMYISHSKQQHRELIASNLTIDEFISQKNSVENMVRGLNDSTPNWVEQYNKGQFQNVIIALNAKKNLVPLENYYLGLAYLKKSPSEYDHAETHILLCLKSGALGFKSKSNLYLGAINIKQGEIEEAKKYLIQVGPEDKNQADLFLQNLK